MENQELVNEIKNKSKRDKVEFVFNLMNEKETLVENKEMLKANFTKEFILLTHETLNVLSIVISNPDSVEGFSDEEGKEYMKNMIIDNVVNQLD